MGIKEEDKPKLFQEFQMLEAHRNINPSGTGLGLFLSRQLIRQMGGDITLKSEFGHGSKFTIELPLDMKPESADKNQTEDNVTERGLLDMRCTTVFVAPRKSNTLQSIITILIVEDETMNAFIMESMLKKLGILTEKAKNGKEAIEFVKSRGFTRAYSLIFMDINMPIMNGLEATSILRDLMKQGVVGYTPIVALSGDEQVSLETESENVLFNGTCNAFLNILVMKPINETRLKKALGDYGIKITNI